MTLVNFMPLDRSHPVALELLLLNLGEAAQRVAAEDVRLLVPASATDVVTALPEGSFVTADDSFGFVYANDTAAARVLVGEKPLPSAVSGTTAGVDPLVSGEAWLCGSERKVVYVGDARVESAAQTTVAELLGAAGVGADDVKAVYLGYPMCAFVVPAHFGDAVTHPCDEARVIGAGDCAVDAVRDASTTTSTASAAGGASLAAARAATSSARFSLTLAPVRGKILTSTSFVTLHLLWQSRHSARLASAWPTLPPRRLGSLATSSRHTSRATSARRGSAARWSRTTSVSFALAAQCWMRAGRHRGQGGVCPRDRSARLRALRQVLDACPKGAVVTAGLQAPGRIPFLSRALI